MTKTEFIEKYKEQMFYIVAHADPNFYPEEDGEIIEQAHKLAFQENYFLEEDKV